MLINQMAGLGSLFEKLPFACILIVLCFKLTVLDIIIDIRV